MSRPWHFNRKPLKNNKLLHFRCYALVMPGYILVCFEPAKEV